jgi:hypothetical protein
VDRPPVCARSISAAPRQARATPTSSRIPSSRRTATSTSSS